MPDPERDQESERRPLDGQPDEATADAWERELGDLVVDDAIPDIPDEALRREDLHEDSRRQP